ncbi:hypothetical protein LXL04_020457 [Taraxacum kok-saghyz]
MTGEAETVCDEGDSNENDYRRRERRNESRPLIPNEKIGAAYRRWKFACYSLIFKCRFLSNLPLARNQHLSVSPTVPIYFLLFEGIKEAQEQLKT